MKLTTRMASLAALLLLPLASFAQVLSGDVTGGGTFAGTVTSSNAWITSAATDGEVVNFWTLTGNAGDVLSIVIDPASSPAIEFGVSVYQGVVQELDLIMSLFDNGGDFGTKTYIAGTNPTTGAIGTSLLDIVLPVSGVYTLAVGGEAGFPFDGLFAYSMDVDVQPVPLPAAVWLLVSGLFGLGALRRRS